MSYQSWPVVQALSSGPVLVTACGVAFALSVAVVGHGVVLHGRKYKAPRGVSDIVALATVAAAALYAAEEIIPSQNEKSGLRRDLLVHLAVHGVGFMVVQVCNCLFILYRVLAINPHLDGLRLTCLLILVLLSIFFGGPLTLIFDIGALSNMSSKPKRRPRRLYWIMLSLMVSLHLWVLFEMILSFGRLSLKTSQQVRPDEAKNIARPLKKRKSIRNFHQNFERSFSIACCSLLGSLVVGAGLLYDCEEVATLFYFVSVLLPIHACFNSPFAQRMRRALRGYNPHARADEKRKAAKVAVIETIGMEPPLVVPAAVGSSDDLVQDFSSTSKRRRHSSLFQPGGGPILPPLPLPELPLASGGVSNDALRIDDFDGEESPRAIVDEAAPSKTEPIKIEPPPPILIPSAPAMLITVTPQHEYGGATTMFTRTLDALDRTIKIHVSSFVSGPAPSQNTQELGEGDEYHLDDDEFYDPEDEVVDVFDEDLDDHDAGLIRP